MKIFSYKLCMTTALAIAGAFSEVQAQTYYYPSNGRTVIPRQGIIRGTPSTVYSSNGVQYQAYRPSYGQTHTNNGYYVQPNRTYRQNGQTYYSQPSTSYYSNYPYTAPSYSTNPVYSSQPSTVWGSNYGTGQYNSTPQQAANVNAGAIIGGALGGNQGAQVGAAIGATIKP